MLCIRSQKFQLPSPFSTFQFPPTPQTQKMDIEQETESVANNKAVPSKRKKKMKNREEAEALQSKRKKKNTEETEAVAVRTSNQNMVWDRDIFICSLARGLKIGSK
ncbi:hypothetical protein P8452_49817 [Trifolium repens]|nr:hypothetical protein P8452_49817 [Trifolium repens]